MSVLTRGFAAEHSNRVALVDDFTDALPRTGTGKVQKRKLRDPYWAGG